jgi:hypothetical protein
VLAAVNTKPPSAVGLRRNVDRRCARRVFRTAGRDGETALKPNLETDGRRDKRLLLIAQAALALHL